MGATLASPRLARRLETRIPPARLSVLFRLTVVTTGMLACWNPAALGATVGIDGSRVVFQADPGEPNELSLLHGPPPNSEEDQRAHLLIGSGGPIQAGPGCTKQGDEPTNDVACPAAGITLFEAFLGDANDSIGWGVDQNAVPTSIAIRLHGGDGADQLTGNPLGGNGEIRGDSGNDTVGGASVILGGDGNDVLRGDAGRPSRLFGERGNDTIQAFGGAVASGPMTASGGPGADRLFGSSFADRFSGGAGNDQAFGRRGNDQLDGGGGNDLLDGGAGRDRLVGAAGRDTVHSDDAMSPPRGTRVRDVVVCGSGRDTVWRDRFDRLSACERRLRSRP